LHQDNHDIQRVTKDALSVLHIFPHWTVDALAVKRSFEHAQEVNSEFSL
jgi:hypothetical protein